MSIISESFKLNIKILLYDIAEIQRGNPYNTTFSIEVFSDGFYGITTFLVNYKELLLFSIKLKDMYESLHGSASIKDLDFGSSLNIECDNFGKFVFSGVIINETFQELKFKNMVDQTYLKEFVYNFSNKIEHMNI